MKRELLAAAAGAIAAGLLAHALQPEPGPVPPVVHVDPAYMEAQRPQLEKPSLGHKLTTRSVKPDQVAIATAPSAGGKKAVAAYCEPLVLLDRGERVAIDSGARSRRGPTVAPPELLPDFGGRRAGSRLELYSTLNDGRRWQGRWTARGRISWESSGDSVLVRGDRLWVRIGRGAPRCAAHGAAGGLFGAMAGQDELEIAVSGLLGVLACAF